MKRSLDHSIVIFCRFAVLLARPVISLKVFRIAGMLDCAALCMLPSPDCAIGSACLPSESRSARISLPATGGCAQGPAQQAARQRPLRRSPRPCRRWRGPGIQRPLPSQQGRCPRLPMLPRRAQRRPASPCLRLRRAPSCRARWTCKPSVQVLHPVLRRRSGFI